MKKVVMCVAVALTAIFGHAAVCNWTATNILSSDGSGATSNGYTAYLFIYEGSASTLAATTAAIDSKDFSVLANAVDTKTTSAGKVTGSGVGNLTPSTTYGAYAVIFDSADPANASNYMVTKEVSKTVAATGATVSFGFGTQAASTWNKMSDVPEPTSGLLLLIGGAMLALRRKQK